MAQVRGLPLKQLDRMGDRFAKKVTSAIKSVLNQLAEELNPDAPSVDNITDLWRKELDNGLGENVKASWLRGAVFVGEQLLDHAALLAAIEIPEVSNEQAENYLATRMNFLRNIGFDVWEIVRTQLLVGFQNGESISQLRDRITDSVGIATPRATVIARTEVVGASNAGSYQQMLAVGLPATKEWLATNDSRTRHSHVEVDGQKVSLTDKFTVGGSFMDRPHDPGAPASEVVNCRCTILFDISDESFRESDEGPALAAGGNHNQKTHGRGGGPPLSGRSIKSNAEGKEFIGGHFGEWEKGLSNSEFSGRSFYQSPGFALMNGQLRGLKKSEIGGSAADLARAKKSSTNLKKAINKAPPLKESIIAHRGFSADQFGELKPGMKIKDKGFTSMSLTSDVAPVGKASSPAVARIELPKGAKVGAGSSRELMANAGSEFDVVSVSQKSGVTHVDLRLVVG